MITRPYNALLFAAALTLAGCQTVTTAPSQNMPQYENIRTMQAVTPDSDGDGVLDDNDECPATPLNVVVDKKGCPFTGMGIGLKMEYRAFFAKGSSELPREYQLELDRVAEQIKKYDTATMKIEAHISEDELDQFSNSLSRNRALMVKNYLIVKHDIEPSRLSTLDCGVRAPIAPSNTEESKSFNRRVYGLVKEPKSDIDYQQPNDLKSKICIEF